MFKTFGYAATSATSPLAPLHFEIRDLRKHDVLIDVIFCGICHSDLHVSRDEWNKTKYPVIPGHEIIGRVNQVGSDVKKFKKGDLVGVGCIIGSCQNCKNCKNHLEQYCDKEFTLVFNSTDSKTGAPNYGGFSKQIVVEDQYVLQIPKLFKEKDLPAVAPLLCAGITTYSPLKHWKVGPGTKVGIVGLGGLGHMAIKLAHAMGAHVLAFTTSPEKAKNALKLGADEVVISTDEKAMKKHENSLDFILNTGAKSHDLNHYLALLKFEGTMCLVGLPSQPHSPLNANFLVPKRKNLAGSLIGGIKETQELLDFCAEHNVLANIKLIQMDQVNDAFEQMARGKVDFRFVIDVGSMRAE